MVKSLLSEEDAREVEAAVARVEQRSATEIVVAVVPSSGTYLRWRVLLAMGWGLAGTVGLHFLWPTLPVLELLVIQPLLTAAVYAVCGVPWIYRSLIPPEEAERAVARRAFALFAEHGVHRTRDRTGLLILISELEHQVVILGDSGLDARLHAEGWAAEVSHLVTRIREGEAKRGLLEVLEHFEPILAELAPVRPDDTNELPDAVVRQ